MLAFDSFGYSAKLVPSEYIGFSIVSMVIIYMGFIFSIYWCKRSVPWDDWCIWFCWDCLICVFTGKFLPSSVDILCCTKHFYWCSLHPLKWWYPIVYMSQSLGHTNSSHSCHCCGGYATWQGIYMSMRLSSSLPSGVDANICVRATLVKLLMNICVLIEVVFTAIVCSRLLKFASFGIIYFAVCFYAHYKKWASIFSVSLIQKELFNWSFLFFILFFCGWG